MTSLNDPAAVEQEYEDESRLAVRASAWEHSTGPNPVTLAREAVAEVKPRRVLEVGPGRGETAEWIARETGADVVAVDQSERMVELTRARGVEAQIGDAQELPFDDASFDCALAAWMLYHVPDINRGVAELARILRPGGRLVAVTNSQRHAQELRALVGAPSRSTFTAENGEEILLRHFAAVERRDAVGYVVLEPDDAIAYLNASQTLGSGGAEPVVEAPLRVTRAQAIFVATK